MASGTENVKYDVCFVIPVAKTKNDVTDNLKLAFEAMDCNELDPTWISGEDCLKILRKEPKLFVIDPFVGKAFEHLISVNCRVVGPLCVLNCLQLGETLPKRAHPVYSVAMRKITITCSNVDKVMRENIAKKVELMAGIYSKDLTKSVSHLIVGDVGSKKYHVAANFGLPIMQPEWIEEVWSHGQYEQTHASDAIYDRFRCPVFKNLSITVSQLGSEERKAVKLLIEKNGGRYSGALKANDTTHLILMEAKGEKFKFAKTWKLHCVKVDWLYDSLSAGYCMDENLYQLDQAEENAQETSTPKKDAPSIKPVVDCSTIANVSTMSRLDETSRSDIVTFLQKPYMKENVPFNVLDDFDISSFPKCGQFLDGCKILLSGFSGSHLEKLRKIVNAGGGMRFSKFSESISHVVCGEKDPDLLDIIKGSSVRPYIVNFQWLIECCKRQKLVDESSYSCTENIPLSPQSKEKQVASEMVDNNIKPASQSNNTVKDDLSDIMKQYLPDVPDVNKGLADMDQTSNMTFQPDRTIHNACKINEESRLDEKTSNTCQSNVALPINVMQSNVANHFDKGEKRIDKMINDETLLEKPEQENLHLLDSEKETNLLENLFNGSRFIIEGFGVKDTQLLSEMIGSNGGVVLDTSVDHQADIAVVPVTWDGTNIKAKTIVSNCWLQMCIEEEKVLSFKGNPLFKPIQLKTSNQPFENCVISVSQYTGTERDCLMHLAEVLGARCQEYFVRKANKTRGLLPNTHLIVPTPEGSKYEAAKKWGIPSVTKYWLLETAQTGKLAPESKYFVEVQNDVQALESWEISDITTGKLELSNLNNDHKGKNVKEGATETSENYKDSNENSRKQIQTVDVNTVENRKSQNEETENYSNSAQNNRIKELIDDNRAQLRKNINEDKTSEQFLDPNVDYQPNFDVSGILQYLDSPGSQGNNRKRNSSLPIEEMFSHNLSVALKNFGDRNDNEKSNEDHELKNVNTMENANIDISKPNLKSHCQILSGVVLCVARKLASIQSTLNKLAAALGAEYHWSYDSTCTHFVFQGKTNDLTREFRIARDQGKLIVSPDWLYACKETGVKVDETLYNHTYKPRMCLSDQISTVKVPQAETNKVTLTQVEDKNSKKASGDEKTVCEIEENSTDVSKQLDDLIFAAKTAKAGKRKSRRMTNCSPSGSGDCVSLLSKIPNLQRPSTIPYFAPEIKEATVHNQETGYSEPSQNVPITWDDPTGRLERERIAEHLATAGKQDTQSCSPNRNAFCDVGEKVIEEDENACFKSKEEWEEQIAVHFSEHDLMMPREKTVKKFMLTGFNDNEKRFYSSIILSLGGVVSSLKTFDDSATHLILGHPLKNEKFLASVACGKWVLHKSYLEASQNSHHFVEEELYEWGSPSIKEVSDKLPPALSKVTLCSRRWRLKLSANKELLGAFHGWKIIVIADKQKVFTYSKILRAGGAEVLSVPSPYSDCQEATHAFVELPKNNSLAVDFDSLLSRGVKCLKPEYLAYYLIEDSPPPEDDFITPHVTELMNKSSISSISSKRQSEIRADKNTKKSRFT